MCQNNNQFIPLKIFIFFIYLLIFLPLICVSEEIVKHCNSEDLIFKYTDCDQNNKRWLFAIPRSHDFLCTQESIPAPLHGLNCSVTCPAGHFLEIKSQKCKLCNPGTFSLGDRVRYEEFESTKLPEGFSIENSPDESFGNNKLKCSTQRTNSGNGGWNVEGNQLRYSWTPCVSTLSISLHLIKPGFAEFQYQISRESKGLIHLLQVKNAQCQNYGPLISKQNIYQKKENHEETNQEGADIRLQKLSLRKGQNLITWTLAVNPVLSSRMEMIRLIRLDISGLAFAPECTECPEGTFSSLYGAQHCEPCGENEFSQKGSTKCQQCPPNMWAEPRSGFCQKRPICSSLDFYPARPSICNENNKENFKIFWRKINPQICIDNDGMVNSLIKENVKENCIPCGPGMKRNNDGYCELCPEGQISVEGKICIPCPFGSIPEYGIFITNWDSIPPGIELRKECEFLSAEVPGECPINPSWISYGTRLESVQTRMRGIAIELNIKLKNQFYSPLHTGKITTENPLGKISLDFSLQCRGSCQFYIVKKIENQQFFFSEQEENLQLLKMFSGNYSRQLISFPVLDPHPFRILIAFTRSNAIYGHDELNDKAIIYSLNITNNGNLSSSNYCIKCPIFENGKCQPCASGEYFNNNKCNRCPSGTILNQTNAINLLLNKQENNSSLPCSPCPQHFQNSNDGLSCEFSGKFDLEDEENNKRIYFDITPLKGIPLFAKGIRIFTRDGQSFTHIFNFTLFPNYPINCHDSIPISVKKRQSNNENEFEEEKEDYNALFCRSAVVPIFGHEINNNNNSEEQLYISSTIISNKLVMITKQREYGGFKLSDEQLEYENSKSNTKNNNRPLDIHFFYESTNILIECPNGTIAVVTIRCDPNIINKPLVRLSRHCPDGTCDGCLYHSIVESALACPICTSKDFKTIRGECINNIQKIHTIPSKHCVISGVQNQEREESCKTILSSNIQLILILTIIIILILLLIICAIYRRNKTLEYRYMRLIEGKEMDNNSRSCALESDQEESDDEDEQEVINSSKARVFFNTKKSKKKIPIEEKYNKKYGKSDEKTEFIIEEESD